MRPKRGGLRSQGTSARQCEHQARDVTRSLLRTDARHQVIVRRSFVRLRRARGGDK
jgi:hypothetical protein